MWIIRYVHPKDHTDYSIMIIGSFSGKFCITRICPLQSVTVVAWILHPMATSGLPALALGTLPCTPATLASCLWERQLKPAWTMASGAKLHLSALVRY